MIEKKEIAKACEKCRNQLVQIHMGEPHVKSIEMTLPIPYRDDETVAAVFIWPYPADNNEKLVIVSDCGDISYRQGLTKKEIEKICKRYGLKHDPIFSTDDWPYKCGLYTVVELAKVGRGIFKIAEAIVESYRIREEKR